METAAPKPDAAPAAMSKYSFDCLDVVSGRRREIEATAASEDAAREHLGRTYLVGSLLSLVPTTRHASDDPRSRVIMPPGSRFACHNCGGLSWRCSRETFTYLIATIFFPWGPLLLLILGPPMWQCAFCGYATKSGRNPNGGMNPSARFALCVGLYFCIALATAAIALLWLSGRFDPLVRWVTGGPSAAS